MLGRKQVVDTWEHRQVAVGNVQLHVVQAGPVEGPLVILLHGFPEYWYSWREYIQPLTDAGYRVWVPDQRGYNLSSKPQGIDAYGLDVLVSDIAGLLDASGQERARLIGHDWGGTVAWWLAMRAPQRVERAVILNAVHPYVWMRSVRANPAQILRGWYLRFFQLPHLPEVLLQRNDWAALARLLTGTSRPGAFSPEDMASYRAAWGQAGAMTGMLNWYRAILRQNLNSMQGRVRVPIELIWGAHDPAAGIELARLSVAQCDRAHLEVIEDATHWVHHEKREVVLQIIERCFR